jgi:hypothetical protein
MIMTARGRVEGKQVITDPWLAEMPSLPTYRLTVRFYDPRTLAFCHEHIHCTAHHYEQYHVGDWVSLQLLTDRWKPFQYWVIAAHVLSIAV